MLGTTNGGNLAMTELSHARPVTFILTRNRPASEAFYTRVLGLSPPIDDGFAAVFDLGGAILRITHIPDHTAGAHPVLGWMVDDIEATIRTLTAAGVAMTIYDGIGQDALGIWTAPDGRARVAFFPDPDGNMLSLTEAG
jgi:catechol 2,3-dioxygenase-like lactoylglutathione lyase family enzyme